MSNYIEPVVTAVKLADMHSVENDNLLRDAFKIVKDFKSGHTSYQILLCILNEKDNPTPDAKYQQALREIDARIEAMKVNYYHLRKIDIEIRHLEVTKKENSVASHSTKLSGYMRESSALKMEECDLEIEKRNMQKDTFHKDVARLMREMDVLVAFCKTYREKLTVDPASYVDSLIEEHRSFLMKLGIDALAIQLLCNTTTRPDDASDKLTARVTEAHDIMQVRHGGLLPDVHTPAIALGEESIQDPTPENVVHLFRSEEPKA